ncbi:DUF2867 domain-containing protein [Streptomyces sp. NPDC127069]|uniref:DUF2867 domain-containing protein n=1 Tax=Streptomyces sp. NPDC127069 TaxID=3347128 RepID=UPI00364A0AC2
MLHIGWVPDGSGGPRAQMAVLVKPSGRLGTLYMLGTKPVRHLGVYPALIRSTGREWERRAVEPERLLKGASEGQASMTCRHEGDGRQRDGARTAFHARAGCPCRRRPRPSVCGQDKTPIRSWMVNMATMQKPTAARSHWAAPRGLSKRVR